ncbi:uncharacterized protein LOC128611975 isoform X2 [Ictalurus furcatus]|uniref:uncharacterized protein LOC128611975 isoform X2 n=1 Tax=Ictalurus furcatus TaxID=66913 RepID=UPI00234FC582|nr:uncharacterized protein LOC128611975 isoform X2 [Ictalurus furcatus]
MSTIEVLKMAPIWTIILFLSRISPALSVDFSRPSFLSVKSGEHVTLKCPFGDIRMAESVVWYKLVFGEMPQKVGEILAYKDVKIWPEFKTSGFIMLVTDNGISLTIPHIKKDDGGLYYCEKCNLDDVSLSNGTFLAVTGDGDVKVSVFQSGVSDSVPAGASVTLQCSVLSESRSAELQVLWFRAAPPQSHPQIIYTHHNSSHQCESGSSTHTCVYNFSKNILSLNDTGTYYCAVAVCGKIIFGNGTRVQLENVSDLVRSLGPEVIYLAVVVAVCVVVIFTQVFIICKMRSREQSRARPQQYSAVEKTANQGRDAAELSYAALHFNKKNTKRVTRKREKPEDCVYTEVSSAT